MGRLIAALVLLFLILIFIFQNLHQVTIHFLLWNFNGSLALILLTTFIVSIIFSLLVALPLSIRKWMAKNKAHKHAEKAKEKIGEVLE